MNKYAAFHLFAATLVPAQSIGIIQQMSAEIIDINERARDAWDAYVAAKERAQATDDFRDGLVAGRAWRTFLNLFAGPEDQMEVAPKILEYPYGARR